MRALVLLTLVVAGAACHRAARPDVSVPVEAFAGEPVHLVASGAEAPGTVWFVDDHRVAQGASVEYAFPRGGIFRIRAVLDREEVFARQITVLPRPVLRAVPPQASQITWIAGTQGALEPAVDFLERAFPSSTAAAEDDPFLRFALELSAGPPPPELGLDPEEGLAAFTLPEVSGSIVTVGVQDEAAALRSARRLFPQRAEGAFVDGGYLYLVITDDPAPARVVEAVREALRSSPPEGVSSSPTLARLRERVGQGQIQVLLRPGAEQGEGTRIEGALMSLQFAPDVLSVDGFVLADRPLWNVQTAPPGSPLEGGAHGPILAGSLSVAPEELAKLLRGLIGGESGAELAQLEAAFTGTVGVTVYFDAKGTVGRLGADPGGMPEFSGTILAQAGVKDRRLVESLVERTLGQQRVPFKKRPAQDATAFLFDLHGRRAVVETTSNRLTLEAGEPLRGREGGHLLEQLRARYGDETFGPGRVSLLIDLGQILRELSSADAVLIGAFLQQLTAIDTVFADVQPVEEGARLKGRVTLRPR